MEVLALPIIIFLIVFLITVAISRWVFRINEIVSLLKSILNALSAGLDLEEIEKHKTLGFDIRELKKNKEERKCFLCSKLFQVGQLSEVGGEFYCPSCFKKINPELLREKDF